MFFRNSSDTVGVILKLRKSQKQPGSGVLQKSCPELIIRNLKNASNRPHSNGPQFRSCMPAILMNIEVFHRYLS